MRVVDTPGGDQPALIVQKLQQCQKVFDFYDPVAQLKSKEVFWLVLMVTGWAFPLRSNARP